MYGMTLRLILFVGILWIVFRTVDGKEMVDSLRSERMVDVGREG